MCSIALLTEILFFEKNINKIHRDIISLIEKSINKSFVMMLKELNMFENCTREDNLKS